MTFLFISLACCVAFAAVFAGTFAIDHFASIWETSEPGTWHARFSAWATGNRRLDIAQGISGIAAAFSCLVFVVAIYYALTYVDVGGERRFALYITGGSGVESREGLRQFFVTRGDLERIPMFDYVDSHRIVKGRVSSAMPIGGGLAHICVDNDRYCGLADSSLGLKAGDIAYIRIGRPPSGRNRPPGWTITAAEADSLATTAKFTIESK
jgi:hypothetical protein